MAKGWRYALVAVPPLVFMVFAAVAFIGLRRENPQELPSALVGREVPSISRLTQLRGDPPPVDADLTAPGVKLVNFWASWCGPCRVEHPLIEALSDSGIQVIGINYKDDPEAALGFLDELGDPYAKVGADSTGRTGLDWGLYGVPETFVIGPGGEVVLRFPGPLDPNTVEARIKPAIAAASGAR